MSSWINRIPYFFLLIYVFIIPIYYQHAKEDFARRRVPWDAEVRQTCMICACIWPLTGCMELWRDWCDLQEFRENQKKSH
jgi:hypothetical protein